MPKVVVQGKSESRCRICASGRRETWEASYQAYLNGEADPLDGQKLTWPVLAQKASLLCGESLTERSCRRHADGHVRVVGEDRAGELDSQAARGEELLDGVLAEIDGLLEGGQMVSPQALLGLQQRLYLIQLRQKLELGEVAPMTHDMGARAAEKLMASAKRAEETSLLAALTGGLSAVFTKALDGQAGGELEAGEVVDGEVVAEEDETP